MVRADRSAAVAAAVALAVIAVAGLAIFAIPASEVPLTYRAASPVARVVGLGAGAALVIAALMTTLGSVAVLLLALAAMWFGQDLAALGEDAKGVLGDDARRDANVLGIGAIVEEQIVAEVFLVARAEVALAAGRGVERDDAIARSEIRDAFAGLYDRAGEFVPESAGGTIMRA